MTLRDTRATAVLSLLLPLLAACATTSPGSPPAGPGVSAASASDAAKGEQLPPGVKGIAAWFRKDYLTVSATWNDERVIVAQRANAPFVRFNRVGDGKWRGGWKGDESTEFEVTRDRILSNTADVRIALVPGGFRLSGLWYGRNVDLEMTAKGARSQGIVYVRDASGGFSPEGGGPYSLHLGGDAARIANPPWPEVVFALLPLHMGVDTYDVQDGFFGL